MTEQELHQERELSLKFRQEAEWVFSVQCMNEAAAIAFAKAYADARESKEIAAMKAEIKRLLNLHDKKDNEITGYKVEIFQLKAENERLRDALSPAPVTEEPQQSDENGLLPCPFCGGKASMVDVYIECGKCHAKTRQFVISDLCKSQWNKRA